MNNFSILRKRNIAIGMIVIVVIVGSFLILNMPSFQKSEYEESLNISNLSEYTRGKPKDKKTLDYIKYDLHRTVSKNSKSPIKNNSIDDIFVRKDTFNQTYDKKTMVHTVTFIADIKSLKQSYDVSYQWMEDDSLEPALNEWGTVVKCLPSEKLIYGNFDCKDMFTKLASFDDPILEFLPYSSPNVTITYDAGMEKVLNIKIETSAADERDEPDLYVEQYKTEAKEWIKSKGFDPNTFTLSYTVVHASLY